MTEIKIVTNKEFNSFLDIVVKLYGFLEPEKSEFEVINGIVHAVNTNSTFIVYGGYQDNKLVACFYGYAKSKYSFHISGLYCLKNKKLLNKLVDHSLKKLKEIGYTAYTAHTSNYLVKEMLENKKAKQISAEYEGEL